MWMLGVIPAAMAWYRDSGQFQSLSMTLPDARIGSRLVKTSYRTGNKQFRYAVRLTFESFIPAGSARRHDVARHAAGIAFSHSLGRIEPSSAIAVYGWVGSQAAVALSFRVGLKGLSAADCADAVDKG
jgi:hypothetical protein